MFQLIRNPLKKTIARAVHIYFSDSSLIVVPIHQNLDGIYFEQSDADVLDRNLSAQDLGHAFRVAFDVFSIVEKDLRDVKKSDSSAFQASHTRSLKQFEDMYHLVSCYSINSNNAIVRASTPHPTDSAIELSTLFNPLLPAEAIGIQLQRLIRTANAT